ncbi:Branched-chain amino acid transport protein (AzlD) [Kytococcus aerolatus]|uniref:Branched-chain amino acid transport protein (AzlD) n=1 Tax=Kytococcus aerolatus TaxID=592308 RepID=A0A212TZY9_9MICO|nr:AzlD domain-containing protein [Kytococcus aerolatus]SNC71446.1 Branched-chain amino acid transport protein (AzlD) [Kytococcus aerolatus]
MSWAWLLVACALGLALKLAGYLLPASALQRPLPLYLAGMVTIGLLTSLLALNTVASGQELRLDARVAALVVAVVALRLRAPFLLVVVLGAAATALVRLLGWG